MAPTSLLHRYRRAAEARIHAQRFRVDAYVVVCGTLCIAVLAALAALTRTALVFPSLGAVAYTMFAHPLSRAARPREVVLGLWIGIGIGYVSALAFGLDRGDFADLAGDWRHVGSASVALAVTTAALLLTRIDHPPACSTALLVALGIWRPWQIAALAGGAVVLVALGFGMNRLAGLPYPLWKERRSG